MKREITVGIFLLLSLLIIGVSGCGQEPTNSANEQEVIDPNQMVDCSKMADPGCFVNRMNQCLPVTAKMIASDGSTEIDITVLGVENETCHFQRKLNGVLNLDCYFPKGTMNTDTLDQTFGNDKGLQKVVDDACKPGGW